MIKIIDQVEVGKYTVLFLDAPVPLKNFNMLKIDGILYETEIVYDSTKSIGVCGTGNFVGKEIDFVQQK